LTGLSQTGCGRRRLTEAVAVGLRQ